MTESTSVRVSPEVATAAADWFMHLQEADVVEEDFQEWQRWLNAAPEHAQAYRQVENAWRLIGEVESVPWPSSQELQADPPYRAPIVERAPRKPLWFALVASVLVALSAVFLISLAGRGDDSYTTRIAEQRTVRLPDGSRVTLGAQSRVTPEFAGNTRSVVLHFGEAFFQVAHDSHRPFAVIVGSSEIRAIGTAFNVHATPEGALVSVTEGRVAIAPAHSQRSSSSFLSAGEQAAITPNGNIVEKTSASVAVTWMQGRFEYRGEELSRVLEDLNRYTDRRIVLADESVGHLRYSGTVFRDQIDEWLAGIGGVLPVTVHEAGDQREIHSAR